MSQTAAHSLNPPQLGIQNLYWIQALQNNKPEKPELINLNNPSENANSFPERFCLLSHSQLPDKEQESDMSTSTRINKRARIYTLNSLQNDTET